VATDTATLDSAVQFRTTFFLDATPETVRLAAVDREAYPDTSWGVPLSTAEAAEMQRRLRTYESVLPLVREARQDPAWAGWWLDHASRGSPVLLFAADPASRRAEFEHLAPKGVTVTFQLAAVSLTALEERRRKVLAAESELAKKGVVLTGVGIDMSGNQLTVDVESISAGTHATIAALAGDRFALAQDGPAGADACPATGCLPLKGGIGMTDQRTVDPMSRCTAGYLARRTDVSPAKLVVVTAGHCIVSAVGHQPWRHGGTDIGNSATKNGNPVHTWVHYYNADVGLVNTGDLPSLPSDRDQLLVDNSPVTEYDIGDVREHADQPEGLPVCRMGRTTGLMCGEIVDHDDTKKSWFNGTYRWIDHVVDTDMDALGGDSGGPIFYRVEWPLFYAVLLGTHVHSYDGPDDNTVYPGKQGWYSPVDRGVNTLSNMLGVEITPCTTNACGL
jgi:hypothetical protein